MDARTLFQAAPVAVLLSLLACFLQACGTETDPISTQDVQLHDLERALHAIHQDEKASDEEKVARFLALGESLPADFTTQSALRAELAFVEAYSKLKKAVWHRDTLQRAVEIEPKKRIDTLILREAHRLTALSLRDDASTSKETEYYHLDRARNLYDASPKTSGFDWIRYAQVYDLVSLYKHGVDDFLGALNASSIAIRLYEEAPAVARRAPDLYHYSHWKSYVYLSMAQTGLKRYEDALETLDQSWEIAKRIPNRSLSGLEYYVLNHSAAIHTHIGAANRGAKSRAAFEEAISLYQEIFEKQNSFELGPKQVAMMQTGLAHSLMMARGEEPSALDRAHLLLESAADSLGAVVNPASGKRRSIFQQARALHHLAELRAIQGDTVEANGLAHKALMLAVESDNTYRERQILETLMVLDEEDPVEYAFRLMSLEKTKSRKNRELQEKFANVELKTAQLTSNLATTTKSRNRWTGAALTLLVLGIALVTIIDQRGKNQKLRFKEAQQASNLEVYNLMLSQKGRVEQGKRQAQRKISEEIHDGVLGELLGIRLILDGLNENEDPEAIAQRGAMIERIRDVEEELRGLSHRLNDASYDRINNFILSVKDLLETQCSANDLEYALEYQEEEDWDRLDGPLKINLYRILQESLQNAIKHANCDRIEVELEIVSEQVRMTIRDNGVGMPENNSRKGIGMKNIRSRVASLKGEWNLESKPGRGTAVTVRFPDTRSARPLTDISAPDGALEQLSS